MWYGQKKKTKGKKKKEFNSSERVVEKPVNILCYLQIRAQEIAIAIFVPTKYEFTVKKKKNHKNIQRNALISKNQ